LVLLGSIENLKRWASSKISLIFWSAGITRRFSNHTKSFESLWKQLYLGSPSANFYFISHMPSSLHWAMIILSERLHSVDMS
jgi:hypothetical protein